MQKCRLRQFPHGSSDHRTSARLRRQSVDVSSSRCARLALANRTVSNPTQNFFDLPDADVVIEKIERRAITQRPIRPPQPLSRFFFTAQCGFRLSADSGQSQYSVRFIGREPTFLFSAGDGSLRQVQRSRRFFAAESEFANERFQRGVRKAGLHGFPQLVQAGYPALKNFLAS